MQEEVEHKTVNFAISTTKLTARTFLKGAQFLLRQYDKNASQGKQSMKRLIRQNRGVTNVEIEKTGIKGFAKYAKRYHIDYTHEAIIDQQTFDLVQKIRGNVRRYPDGWGEAAPLTGLLYCADCGGKMYVHRTNNGKRISQYPLSESGAGSQRGV